MSQLKLGVVGVGALGRHHARILSEMDGVELAGVAETNPTIGQQVAEACNSTCYADYQELLPKVDAACIVVPSVYHLDVAEDFLKQGIPLMIEKPLAATLEEAERIIELSREHDSLVQVGHIERFNPAFQEVLEAATTPKYIKAERLSPYTFRSTDIGVVHDLMIHDLDLVLEIANSPIKSVSAFGASILGGNEDSAQARITFENGCIADISSSRVHPEPKRTLHCWGYFGSVTADLGSREVKIYRESTSLKFGPPLKDRLQQPGYELEQMKKDVFGKYLEIEEPNIPQTDQLTDELQNFVESVSNGTTPLVDAAAGLRAMEAADLVMQSLNSHQWDGHAAGPIGPNFETPDEGIRKAA